ncbi:hypothetical protein [Catenulispora pinisilvae]|uniref:hypothetical protein n=1 Tax=Catenulispora pinisilvae TaxID=2705253 RepID=UPI00189105CF|nr:hypothetical protein [Catenulispora pinisilvae]
MFAHTVCAGRGVALAGATALLVLGSAAAAVADPAPTPTPPIITAPANPMPSPSLPGIYGPGFSPDSNIPAPSGPVPGEEAPSPSDPGLLDIPGQIEKAIDEWFGKLVKLALDPVLHLLGATLLSSPNLTDGRIAQVWDGVLITANTLYVLFVLVAGVTVMGHETVQTRYSLKQIAPRLLIGVVASNASLWTVNQVVAVGNALSGALMDGRVAADGIGNILTSLIVAKLFLPSGPMNLFFLLVGLVLAVLGAALLVGYLTRAAILVVLTAGSPLALACHALPQTEGIAKLWWRAVFGCVAVQTLQALVLITAVQVFFDPQANTILGLPNGGTLMDLLICLCLFTVLLKIPGWVRRIVMGRSPFHSSPLSGIARQLVLYQGIRAAAPYLGMAIRHRLFPTPPHPTPPAPPSPGTGLAPRHPGPGTGGGGLGGWQPRPESVTVTQTDPGDPSRSGPGTPSNPSPPASRRPPRPHGPPERSALPPVPTPPQLPPGPFGRMLARAGPELRGRQMGLFPRPAPAVRPEPPLPPPGPAVAHGRSGVVHQALFSPTTLAPLPHATPSKSSAQNPQK